MPSNPTEEPLHPASTAMPLLDIGVWVDDPGTGLVRGDAIMARIFGLAAGACAEGIPWQRLTAIFHPEDFARDTVERRRVRDEGGLFAWEHRIVPAPGVVRWVLARGYFKRDADGLVRGRGIVIDVTESRTDDPGDGPARFMTAVGSTSPLDQIAERAMGLWELLHDLAPADADRLRHMLRPLLYEIGRQIAALTDQGKTDQGKPEPGRTRH